MSGGVGVRDQRDGGGSGHRWCRTRWMRGLEAFVAFDIMVLSRRGFYSVPFLRKCMKCMDRGCEAPRCEVIRRLESGYWWGKQRSRWWILGLELIY